MLSTEGWIWARRASVSGAEPAASERGMKTNIRRAVEQTANCLGNTPAVCRKSYIHPAVIEAYRDGSLAGSPRVVRQEGITEANRPQAARHAEQAIRAVELAAPFDLPDQYYDAWKRVTSFRFDKRLSQ